MQTFQDFFISLEDFYKNVDNPNSAFYEKKIAQQKRINLLKDLVSIIRPRSFTKIREIAEQKIQELTKYLNNNLSASQNLKKLIEEICLQNNPLLVLTEVGIMGSKGFWAEAYDRLSYKILPPLHRDSELRTVINEVFYFKSDYNWINSVSNELWIELAQTLQLFDNPEVQQYFLNEMLNAIVVLAQKATSLALEPEIIEKLPDMDDLNSPFLSMLIAITKFVEKSRSNPDCPTCNKEELEAILVLLQQCEDSIERLHKYRERYGISLRITYLIQRLTQNIERLKKILNFINPHSAETNLQNIVFFFKEIVTAENQKYSLRKHFSDNLGFLAYKIVEQTAQKGEHYIANDKKEYYNLFKKALGGGVIVAFLVLIKAKISYLEPDTAPLLMAIFYSLTYSLGFILIHICHFTLATKQPAMTASTIANLLDEWRKFKNPKSKERVLHIQLLGTLIKMIRSQFISLTGNVLAVIPVAYLLTMGYFWLFESEIISFQKAEKTVQSLSPWQSFSLLYAGIAGIFLMTAGLIAGFYDNQVVFSNIPERIKRYSFLRKILPQTIMDKFIKYIEKNTGALASNFFLGIFLGSTSSVGKIIGLGIDIRHVTFAGGSFAMSLEVQHGQMPLSVILETLLGVFLIGFVNVAVSFGLSVTVALKSRNITFLETGKIIGVLLKAFFKKPLAFFFPLQVPTLLPEEKEYTKIYEKNKAL